MLHHQKNPKSVPVVIVTQLCKYTRITDCAIKESKLYVDCNSKNKKEKRTKKKIIDMKKKVNLI